MRLINSGIRDLFHPSLETDRATLCLDIHIAVSDGGFPAFGTTVALFRATESARALECKAACKGLFPTVLVIKFVLG
jgi:hypothetical protein